MQKILLAYRLKPLLVAAGLLWGFSDPVTAADGPARQVFAAEKTPGRGAAQSIGYYSRGCLAGAREMPLSGPGWQILRPGRNRNWGHPALVAFLERLSRNAAEKGWTGLLIGDLSQPRGGPMPDEHLSHQTGLEADIMFTPMTPEFMSRQQRRNTPAISMLQEKSLYIDEGKWTFSRTELLKLAATDPQVVLVFVHPGIKKHLCDTVTGNQSWLGRVRPYWGHDRHFHIRLQCQNGSPGCQPQPPVPKGSGCDSSLDWWFSNQPWMPKARPSVRSRILKVSDLPPSCTALVEKHRKTVSSKKMGVKP